VHVIPRLVSLVVPSSCVACGAAVVYPAEALCPRCRAALPWLRGPLCPRCALPAHGVGTGGGAAGGGGGGAGGGRGGGGAGGGAWAGGGGAGGGRAGVAAGCPAARGPLDAAWAPLAHEGPARAIVHALKFRGAVGLVDLMAAQFAANAPPGLLDGVVLVPVPAHPARRRARGFDHAERLAAAVSERTGRQVVTCLRRSGTVRRQVGATRAARVAGGRVEVQLDGRGGGIPPPPVVALVDDVHTTGATLRACAAALRAGGSRRVVGVTYARALSSPGGVSTV
jgi:predicted amidophosphoribosyltransferase